MPRYSNEVLAKALAGFLLTGEKGKFAELAKALGRDGYDVPVLLVKATLEYERLK